MKSQIKSLVAMRDVDSLYELMTEDDEWMNQLDAAEGLVRLGDRRGYEFLMSATLSDDEAILEVANEILVSPELAKMRAEIEAERDHDRHRRVESARLRLQKGGKVFRYKMVYLPAGAILSEDPLNEGFAVPGLENHGLEGWEVVNIIPRRRTMLVGGVDDHFTGAYFLLKKEVPLHESADLDKE
jgi:hypothetical protein